MLILFKIKCKLMTRGYVALFFTIIFCPMLLIIFGSIYGNNPSPIFNNLGTVDVSIPAYTGLIFAGSGLISLPIAVAGTKERGELRRYAMTPIHPMMYLLTEVFIYFLISVIGMAILMVIGYFGYKSVFQGNVFYLILGFVLSGLCIFSIGLFVASVAKTARIAQAVGMFVAFPMMFLSGAGMPLELLPSSIKKISQFFPLTYSVSLMRKIWVGSAFAGMEKDCFIMLGISAVFICLTTITFRWD
jgi:ABC-2 type transport system permease protein